MLKQYQRVRGGGWGWGYYCQQLRGVGTLKTGRFLLSVFPWNAVLSSQWTSTWELANSHRCFWYMLPGMPLPTSGAGRWGRKPFRDPAKATLTKSHQQPLPGFTVQPPSITRVSSIEGQGTWWQAKGFKGEALFFCLTKTASQGRTNQIDNHPHRNLCCTGYVPPS